MQNIKLKAIRLSNRMSILDLSVELTDSDMDKISTINVSIPLEPQIYSRKDINAEDNEKPRYISGAFKDGKFTDKTLNQIGRKVRKTVEKLTGTDEPQIQGQIIEEVRSKWTYSLA